MLSRLRKPKGPPPDPTSVNYTPEHVALSKTIARRRRWISILARRIPQLRLALWSIGFLWLLTLPYEGLWKDAYVDEHALQPAQVTTYYDWENVHKADRYLDHLEKIVHGSFDERSTYLRNSFADVGVSASNTSTATYAHITPPRSAGTETILVSANWISRDGGPNLRGVAMLLSLADFLQGQNHWAFDIVLVAGEGYIEGLEVFMNEYHQKFAGTIWTALNIDYPGHSFSHLGLFYEGVNGRLPNQDLLNSVAHIARWTGGVDTRLHDIDNDPPTTGFMHDFLGSYILAAQNLISHSTYAALGRPSAAHGVLSKHRIDAITLYCVPAIGPHGFHTLGKTIESSLRSMNNLLERLHASYFFYLLPRPGKFIPVGHYLPAAVLIGASFTIGGFGCPEPMMGAYWLVLAFAISGISWLTGNIWLSLVVLFVPKGTRGSLRSLTYLLYGALTPTLAMVNFPQSILLAGLSSVYLCLPDWARWGVMVLHPGLVGFVKLGEDLRWEWEVLGNLAWPGVWGIWLSLWIVAALL